MEVHYLDASALTKRYVEEKGSFHIHELFFQEDPFLLTSLISELEISSALARRKREGSLREDSFQRAAQKLEGDIARGIFIVELSREIAGQAKAFLFAHHLRPGDAIHLATAIVVRSSPLLGKEDELIFVCSDQRLKAAAERENLSVLDPQIP